MTSVKKKPTILILLPCWGRPEILEQTVKQMLQLQKCNSDQVNINPLYIISPEDVHFDELCKITSGYLKVYYKNNPLGEKHNAGINWAMKNLQFSYMMNMGSDSLIHPYLIDFYLPYMLNKELFFGLNSIYFHDKEHTIYFQYIDKLKVIGAGRMIHRDILTIFRQRGRNLYDNYRNSCMDGCSSNRIHEITGHKERVIDTGEFPFICELKSDINISTMKKVLTFPNIKHVDSKIISEAFKTISII